MTEEKTRVDGKLDSEKWEELTEYIDDKKNTRKHSKQFYLERILDMALTIKRHRETQQHEHEEKYHELQKDMRQDMGIDQESTGKKKEAL